MRGSNGDLSLLLPDNDIIHTFKDAMIGKLHSRQMLTRYSQDGVVNAHGKRLLETCISSGLLIMNGRLGYDSGLGDTLELIPLVIPLWWTTCFAPLRYFS